MVVRRGWALVVVLALGVALAGCGGDDEGGEASDDVEVSATSETADDAPPATAEDGTVRYLAMGDSVTQGVGVDDLETEAFPALLAEEWRGDGCEVELLNVGISGYTAAQMLTDEVPNIADFQPTVITFQSGANDIVNGVTEEEYRTDVGAVLDAATGSGARVLVLYQNDWYAAPAIPGYGDPADFEVQHDAYDEILEEEAEARGAEMVDIREVHAETQDQWVDDGIHPTPEVYAQWATSIADAVPGPC